MMPVAFADTSFWLARNFPEDQWHQAAIGAERTLSIPLFLITTEEVLTEFLASVAGNELTRHLGVRVVDGLQANPRIEVIPQSAE